MKRYLLTLPLFVWGLILPVQLFAQPGNPDPSTGSMGCENAPLVCNIFDLTGYTGATSSSGSSTVCRF